MASAQKAPISGVTEEDDKLKKRPASEIEPPAAQEAKADANAVTGGMTGMQPQQPSSVPPFGLPGSAAVPSPAAGTPEEPPLKKRRGRPPGSKNKPKPPTHVGMPSVAASSKQPLKPAPVFRPTDPGQPSANADAPQAARGDPNASTHEQLLASGINLPVGSTGGVASSAPASSPTNRTPQHAPLQHQPAMPQGVQGPSSIPNTEASLALPAPSQGPAIPSPLPLAKKRGRPPGSKNKPRPSPVDPAPGSHTAALQQAAPTQPAAPIQPPTAPAANPVAPHGDTNAMLEQMTGQQQPLPMGMPRPAAEDNQKRRGRPPGSKNKAKVPSVYSPTGAPAGTPFPSPTPHVPGPTVQPIKEAAPVPPHASIPSGSGTGLQLMPSSQNGTSPASGKKPRGRPKGSKNRVKPSTGPSGPLPGGTVVGIPIGQFPPQGVSYTPQPLHQAPALHAPASHAAPAQVNNAPANPAQGQRQDVSVKP
ncbi:hypothetical protein WJX74_006782 [Apatococcus lobatus]|uniref:Uncharacterized protein n=1 Tax=Apatococcus lobatus TaxID=904363 RepID=A0AAW1S5E2_9CHLO